MALQHAFGEIESRLFAGRSAERRALAELVRLSAQSPVAVYIHGPREIGKSALLRALLRETGRPALLLRGAQAQEGAQAILTLLAAQLTEMGHATEPTLAAVRGGLQRAARRSGLILAVDGYEDLGAAERWLREQILYHIGAGTLVALCGRPSPTQLWPGERVWRAFVRPLALGELPAHEASELLARQGIGQEAMRLAAYAAVGGWPRSLLAAADALQTTPACGPAEVAGRVVEQLLHPGSRRQSWRARGSSGDELVAAAVALPRVQRDALRVAVGGDVLEQGLDLLMRIAQGGEGGYRIPERLRVTLAAQVARVRPWQVERWRAAVLNAALARCRAQRGAPLQDDAWREIAALARRTPWHAALHPAAESGAGWTVQRGDLAEEELGSLPQASSEDKALCGWLMEHAPLALLTLRSAGGGLLSWLSLLPLPVRGGPLPAHALWTSLPPALVHRGGAFLGPGGETTGAIGGVAVLVRSSVPDWIISRRVYAATGSLRGPLGEDLLDLLGFQPVSPYGALCEFEAPGQAHQLLDRLPSAPRAAALTERERALAVKEALGRLITGDLDGTRLADFLQARDGEGADPGSYLRDALLSADLGKPEGTGREILRLYYMERVGGHEGIADRLGLPRATYFRLHKQALSRLGAALLG